VKAFALLCLLSLVACTANEPAELALHGNTMGTQFNVKLAGGDAGASVSLAEIEASLADIEHMMSTYQPDSEISRFNSAVTTDWYPVSAPFCRCVQQALGFSRMTDGAFDITVGPLVKLWGFGPGAMVFEPPADEAIAAKLATVGYGHLQADCSVPALRKDLAGLELDMSAYGKGFAVDRVAELLNARGYSNYLVEVGGELRLKGHNAKGEPWAIGIEAPLTDQRRPYTIVHLTDTAMATSGDYRNYFESGGHRYSHTIDTRTGRPVTHSLASVTVVDDSGYRADSLATALLVMGPDRGMQFALQERLAVLFLLRNDSGFDERTTPAFDRLRAPT
jgi:FAD:protein FMN transferase